MWLYKGAWQEWDISEIEMAIPMSPDQVMKKRYGIFIHQSQKDMVPFQGSDTREFWQRAEDRNATTAESVCATGPDQICSDGSICEMALLIFNTCDCQLTNLS